MIISHLLHKRYIIKITLSLLLIIVCLAGGLVACSPASPALKESTDLYTNSVTGGSLVFPESWQGKYTTASLKEYDDRTFIQVYSKSNHDKFKEENSEFGYLFSIQQVPLEELEKNTWWDGGNMGDSFRAFAQKKTDGKDWIYFVRTPTDVQYDIGDDRLKEEYLQMESEIPLLLQSFSERGKLEEYSAEIKLLKYRKGEVKNTILIPRSNKELFERISFLLAGASPSRKQSVNDSPDTKSYVRVMLSPQNIYYLYEKGGKYYAEKPYQSISTLSREAYEEIILATFGVLLADPDTLDKQQFLKPIQEMIALYQAGKPPENGMDLKYQEFPEGAPFPVVRTTSDFELDEGAPPEYRYTATVHFGDQSQYEMVMQFNPFGAAQWQVTGVTFQEPIERSMSSWFFDLAIANRFDYVPEFTEGYAPSESPEYLYYAFILFDLKEWKAGHDFLTVEYVEDVITSHFQVKKVIHQSSRKDWHFDGKVYTVQPGSFNTEPIYRLKKIDTYKQDGKKIYDVVAEQFNFDEFSYMFIYDYEPPAPEDSNDLSKPMTYVLEKKGEKIKNGELQVWEAIREMIAEGDTANFKVNHTEHFRFSWDKQTNQIIFLEHTSL